MLLQPMGGVDTVGGPENQYEMNEAFIRLPLTSSLWIGSPSLATLGSRCYGKVIVLAS